MKTLPLLLTLAMMLALSRPAGASADDRVLQQLLAQGRYWHLHERDDLAQDIWARALRVDPRRLEALDGLAEVAITKGDRAAAEHWLALLRASHPQSAETQQVWARVAAMGGDLDRARQAAARGRYPEAVADYRRGFGGVQPPLALAAEYDQALAGESDPGWRQAVDSLRGLEQSNPGRQDIALALATLLSYHPATRREAIGRLSALAGGAEAASVQTRWRQALLWLDADQPDDAALYHQYLARYPSDAAVAARAQQLRQATGAPRDAWSRKLLDQAFRNLHQGQGVAAASLFEQVLKRYPDNPEASGGLGSALLQQQRFKEAAQWLERAARQSPQWKPTLQVAQYWLTLGQIQTLAARAPQLAVQQLQQLTARDPGPAAGWSELSALALREGLQNLASEAAGQALQRDPGAIQARRVAIQVDLHQGDLVQARAKFQQLSQLDRDELGGWSRLSSGRVRRQAARLWLEGRLPAARQRLQQALLADPDNPWLRLDLARLAQAQGQPQQAGRWLEPLRHGPEGDIQGLYAWALFHAEIVDRVGSYQALKAIAPARRTSAMRALLRQVAIELEASRAQQLAAEGQWPMARQLLDQLEATVAEGPPGDMGAVAEAYARVGEKARALRLANRLLGYAQGDQTVPVRLQYAWIMLAADQGAELAQSLQWLAGADLDIGQRKQLQALREAEALRRFEQARLQGEDALAQAALQPWLLADPDSPQILAAEARLEQSRQRPGRALALYRKALQEQPGDLDLELAEADAAAQSGARRQAGQWLRQISLQVPDERRVLAARARLARSEGHDRAAIRLYAQALQRPQPPPGLQVMPLQRLQGPHRPVLDGRELAKDAGIAGIADIGWELAPAAPARQLDTHQNRAGEASADELRREMQTLQSRDSSYWASGPVYRSRSGGQGLGHLLDIEMPVQGRLALDQGWLTATATPTWLDAGRLAATYSARQQFGSGPAATLADAYRWSGGGQQAHGTAVALAWDRGGLHLDIGTTPQGFEQSRLLGGLGYQGRWGADWTYSAQLSRRSLSDSLISLAGTVDPRTGQRWGAVTANGGRFQLGRDHGGHGFYLDAAWAWLTGTSVRDNSRLEVGGGQYFRLLHSDLQTLNLGWNLSWLQYRNNQQSFLYGEGGYFSPQRYANLGMPLRWQGHRGRFNWRLDMNIGVQAFYQQASADFPQDALLQQAATRAAKAAAAAGLGGDGLAFSSAQHRLGPAYGFNAAAEYQLVSHWYFGSRVELDNASHYRQFSGGVYLRFQFDDAPGMAGEAPVPLISPYGIQNHD